MTSPTPVSDQIIFVYTAPRFRVWRVRHLMFALRSQLPNVGWHESRRTFTIYGARLETGCFVHRLITVYPSAKGLVSI